MTNEGSILDPFMYLRWNNLVESLLIGRVETYACPLLGKGNRTGGTVANHMIP